MQNAAIPTYHVGKEIKDLIDRDPNITQKEREDLASIYNGDLRTYYFDVPLSTYVTDQQSRDGAVQSGFQAEIQKVKADRTAFVEALAGTEEIGYSE